MFSDLKTKGRLVPTNLRKFLCDKEADIENLPTSCSAGSLAYVIESGKRYILNNEKDWVEKVCAAGSGSGSGSGSGTSDLPEELTDPEIDAIFN